MAAWQPAARAFNVEGASVDERNKAEGTQQVLEKLKPLRTIYQGPGEIKRSALVPGQPVRIECLSTEKDSVVLDGHVFVVEY